MGPLSVHVLVSAGSLIYDRHFSEFLIVPKMPVSGHVISSQFRTASPNGKE
jgi:hypothetical protein